MFHSPRIVSSLAFVLALSGAACDPFGDTQKDLEDAFTCNDAFGTRDPEPTRVGKLANSYLSGLCTPTTCTEDKPLAVGTNHSFSIELTQRTIEGLSADDELS